MERLRDLVRDPAFLRDTVADEADALLGQRVRAQIGVRLRACEPLPLAQPPEHPQEARGGLSGALEVADGGLVGVLLLRAAVLQERLLRQCLAAAHDRDSDVALAGDDGAGAEDGRQDHLDRRVFHRVLRADQMTAGDMADLVGDHADDLAGFLGGGQQAAAEEEIGAARDEGVDAAVVDDVEPDRAGAKARSLQQWRGIGANGILDLGVADERHALCLRRRRCRKDQGEGYAGECRSASRTDGQRSNSMETAPG